MTPRRQLTPEERRLARIFYLGVGAFLVIGYALYFAARLLPPPAWALQMIEALKPTLGALVTAELVSDSPFPAQVVIAYAVLGWFLYIPWFSYWILYRKKWRSELRAGLLKNFTRPRLILVGLGGAVLFYLWTWFVRHQDIDIGWQEVLLLTPNLVTVSLHMVGTLLLCVIAPMAFYFIWVALTWQHSRGASSNSSQSD